MRTPEQHVEFVKNNYKGTSTTSMTSLWYVINDVALVQHHWRHSGVLIINFEQTSHIFVIFIAIFEQVCTSYYIKILDHCAKCNGDYV